MRKIILVFTLIPFLSFGQEVDLIQVTHEGVNGYMVKQYDTLTNPELYKSVKKWMQYNIYNAEFSENSDLKNEYIAFRLNDLGEIYYKNNKGAFWTMDVDVEIRFKDNRVRLDIQILGFNAGQGNVRPLHLTGGGMLVSLFNNKGKERKAYKSIKDSVNENLAQFTERFFNSISGKVDYKKDDW